MIGLLVCLQGSPLLAHTDTNNLALMLLKVLGTLDASTLAKEAYRLLKINIPPDPPCCGTIPLSNGVSKSNLGKTLCV